MPKLLIVIDQRGWCGERRALALQRYAPEGWAVTVKMRRECDRTDKPHIVMFTFPAIPRKIGILNPNAILVSQFVNGGWPHNRDVFDATYRHCDYVLFNDAAAYADVAAPRTFHAPVGVCCDEWEASDEPRANVAVWAGGVSGSNYRRQDVKGLRLAETLQGRLRRKGVDLKIVAVDPHGAKKTQRDMQRLYNRARVLLVTSKSEGVPNVALEAACCGCAVVGPPVGVLPELLDGSNGAVAERTEKALGDAVVDAVRRWPSMGEAIASRVSQFDWATRAARYYEVFHEMLDAGKPAAPVGDCCAL